METVSASLAHDVGHELATVSCLVAAVATDPSLSPQSRRRLDLVEQELRRLQELIGLGVGEAVPPEVPLAALVAEVVEPLASISATAVTAVTETSTPDVKVRVDRRTLWRLLTNLVGNAVRAAGPDGTVRVHVADRRPPVIEVHDDGPGLGHGPGGHAGLGLATSRDLAARCGADVSFAPAATGGTVARVAFGHGAAAVARVIA